MFPQLVAVEVATPDLRQLALSPVADAISPERQLSSPSNEGIEAGYPSKPDRYPPPFETADVRRLIFVSFADTINFENAEGSESLSNRGNIQISAPSSNAVSTVHQDSSPSPLHPSASFNGLGTSPSLPTSMSMSVMGLDTSPTNGVHRACR
ncbi:hypothetical protein MAP00_009296 [Monascus purpureus]|nr:hypothetical protein MAP00_009296 [Monascus purpureus]